MIKFLTPFLVFALVACNQKKYSNDGKAVKIDTLSPKSSNNSSISFIEKYPLVTLLRKTSAEIGCFLESELHYKDPMYNCSNKNYINKGDPCSNNNIYYEGIAIPDSIAKKINPAFQKVGLAFEHGNLQELFITFKDSVLKNDIKSVYQLPEKRDKFPSNIINIQYGENIISKIKPIDTTYTKWLTITGFDHIGAGELDCK